MEKADILEMAVKHLRQIQRQQYTSEYRTCCVHTCLTDITCTQHKHYMYRT